MGATHIHNVNKLSLDSSWELLCKRVFTNNDTRDLQRMKDIGMKIVEKCDGLPIAIKTIAGVLVTKDQNRREWENVLNSDAWTITGLPEDLRGALYLSYESVPSFLKQCFIYCSLNPPRREFFYEDLTCAWIAEGFIEASGSASIDDVATGYYRELIWRSFLQPSPRVTNMSKCTMHDTLRALAQVLAGDENFSGDLQEAQSSRSLKKLRRLNIISNKESVSISHLDGLRSLSLRTPPSLNTEVIQNLKHLRLLILNGDKIENIPDNIGDLAHLRLLDLNSASICKLPDSLGNLANLQFLFLVNCKSLHILPRSITKLYNLRRILLSDTLNYIPKGIGKLEHLQHVMGFIVGNYGDDGEEGCNLEELQMLEKPTHLRIENLERVTNKSSLLLANKTHLRLLTLCCAPNISRHIQLQKMDNIVQVFNELCPPSTLEKLVFHDYFGGQYPTWMISSAIVTVLPELTSLHLYRCLNCPHLPQLGQLPQLKYLKIEGADAVVSIGLEFLGDKGKPMEIVFPKLENLLFWNMINWEEWSLISGEQEDNTLESSKLLLFPNLKSISIHNCPKLKAFPSGLNQASIQRLYITGALSLSRISQLPVLRELEVIDCRKLMCVEKLESLQRLKLIDHQKNKTSLPQWLISFLQQREQKPHDDRFLLHLECSVQALRDCLQGHRYWSFLQQVPYFTAYAKNKSMYLKYTKEPYFYENNIIHGLLKCHMIITECTII